MSTQLLNWFWTPTPRNMCFGSAVSDMSHSLLDFGFFLFSSTKRWSMLIFLTMKCFPNLYDAILRDSAFQQSIGWVALSSLVRVFVPHRWHLHLSPLYDVLDYTNHTFSKSSWYPLSTNPLITYPSPTQTRQTDHSNVDNSDLRRYFYVNLYGQIASRIIQNLQHFLNTVWSPPLPPPFWKMFKKTDDCVREGSPCC